MGPALEELDAMYDIHKNPQMARLHAGSFP
jgi:hypothetical protein